MAALLCVRRGKRKNLPYLVPGLAHERFFIRSTYRNKGGFYFWELRIHEVVNIKSDLLVPSFELHNAINNSKYQTVFPFFYFLTGTDYDYLVS